MSASLKESHNSDIKYNTSGFLATRAVLDRSKTDQFVEATDLRFDVIVTDSGKVPETPELEGARDISGIFGNDIRGKYRLLRKPLYTLSEQDNSYIIELDDQTIDTRVRNNGIEPGIGYLEETLKYVNGAVRRGLSESLTREKLGFKEQWFSYFATGVETFAGLADIIKGNGSISVLTYTMVINIMIWSSIRDASPDVLKRRPAFRSSWKESWLPPLPIDKWVVGETILAIQRPDFVVSASKRW